MHDVATTVNEIFSVNVATLRTKFTVAGCFRIYRVHSQCTTILPMRATLRFDVPLHTKHLRRPSFQSSICLLALRRS